MQGNINSDTRSRAAAVCASCFLSDHVFGDYRRQLLNATLFATSAPPQCRNESSGSPDYGEPSPTWTSRSKGTIRNFDLVDDPDEHFIRDINERRAELRAQREQLELQLAEVELRILVAPNPALLGALPMMKIEVDPLPQELARVLFEALWLEVRYNCDTNTVTCRATLSGPTVAAASRAAHEAAVIWLVDARQRHVQCKQEKGNKITGCGR